MSRTPESWPVRSVSRSPLDELGDPERAGPSRRLLAAIVRRAVLDFALYRDVNPESEPLRYALATDAAGWLFFDGTESVDEEGRYTFLYLCMLLGLDARSIREQALSLTRKDLQRFNGDAGPT
jgi:hypothetical protein